MKRRLVALLLACHAAPAVAFFDVQMTAGKRWYQLGPEEEGKFGALEFDVAGHLNPLPTVPVSFGVAAAVIRPNEDERDVDEAAGFQAGLELGAWLPMVPVVTPFVRLNVPVTSRWTTEKESDDGTGKKVKYESTAKVSGYRAALGGKYDLLPVLKLVVEFSMGAERYEVTEVKVAGEKNDALKDEKRDLKSRAVMAGFEMGL